LKKVFGFESTGKTAGQSVPLPVNVTPPLKTKLAIAHARIHGRREHRSKVWSSVSEKLPMNYPTASSVEYRPKGLYRKPKKT
jgi:hypothetical protein